METARRLLIVCALMVCVAWLFSIRAESAECSAGSQDYLHASQEIVRQWRDLKFGLFIHWGPVSLKGTEIAWSRGGERRGRKDRGGIIPIEVYDNLYKQFNPVKFDAKQWVAIAKSAGMNYLVFVTKCHDGFCMFDSKLTDYKITNSPFNRDVAAELAEACHQGGLRLGFYYSPPDWCHPDYRTENHAKYIEFLHGQIRELCSNYGRLDILWFDGLGGSAKDWDSANLFKMIRRLQPHIIINNRAGLPGDFDTPEQSSGGFQTDRPWETCDTLGTQWAWKPDDEIKSLKECIHILVKSVGRGGNLLLNTGPMPNGEIEPRQVARFREIGNWLKKYGRSIYATRCGPFRLGIWGASTFKDNVIYLHILDWECSGDVIMLPAIERKIITSSVLSGGEASLEQNDAGIEVSVPLSDRHDIDTIVTLELDGPAAEIHPINVLSGSVATGKKIKASNFRKQGSAFSPERAVDDDDTTWWDTDVKVRSAWLEVDLGKATTIDRATIWEKHRHYNIRRFKLEYKDGEDWKTIVDGNTIGEKCLKFTPVTARFVRLNITRAVRPPSIWEFQLFAPKDG